MRRGLRADDHDRYTSSTSFMTATHRECSLRWPGRRDRLQPHRSRAPRTVVRATPTSSPAADPSRATSLQRQPLRAVAAAGPFNSSLVRGSPVRARTGSSPVHEACNQANPQRGRRAMYVVRRPSPKVPYLAERQVTPPTRNRTRSTRWALIDGSLPPDRFLSAPIRANRYVHRVRTGLGRTAVGALGEQLLSEQTW